MGDIRTHHNQDVSSLIPAAGLGERLGLGPKALLTLNGQPLITWVARKALRISNEVIISAPDAYLSVFKELCPGCQVISGGETRQSSVARLVAASTRDYVLIHDAARPFASVDLMTAAIAKGREVGCAGTFLPPDTPVAVMANGLVIASFQREQVGVFQSPLVIQRKLLLEVLHLADTHHWQEQSTLQLMLRAKKTVGTVIGEKNNLKLTTEEDWQMAQHLTDYL